MLKSALSLEFGVLWAIRPLFVPKPHVLPCISFSLCHILTFLVLLQMLTTLVGIPFTLVFTYYLKQSQGSLPGFVTKIKLSSCLLLYDLVTQKFMLTVTYMINSNFFTLKYASSTQEHNIYIVCVIFIPLLPKCSIDLGTL